MPPTLCSCVAVYNKTLRPLNFYVITQSPGEKVGDEEVKKRQELFSNLDQQYEQARVVTHTQV